METFLKSLPIAHRGLHDSEKPENSLAAFEAAIKVDYAIETDVRLSRDNKLVVFHDDSLFRMTGVKQDVSELSADELKRIRLENTQEQIPLFEEFLKFLDGRTPLLLEIKNMPKTDRAAFIGAIAKALEGYKGEFAVQSFQPFYVEEFKRLRPDIPCGVLGTARSTKADFGGSLFWKIKARVLKNMSFNKRIKPEFISYNLPDYPQKSTEKFTGIKLAWTVRSPEEEAVARKYADNIIFENYLPAKP